MRGPYFEADWRREPLRTNLWLVPVVQTLADGCAVHQSPTAVDRSAYDGVIHAAVLGDQRHRRFGSSRVGHGRGGDHHGRRHRFLDHHRGADAGLDAVRAADAAQLRARPGNSIVRWEHLSATFCYAMLALVSVGGGPHGDFVPHLSITVTLMLDVGRRRGADLLPQSHRYDDPASGGDRQHRDNIGQRDHGAGSL